MQVDLCPLDDLTDLEYQEWDALYRQQTGLANPFCAPEWVSTWYRHFTRGEPEQCLLMMRQNNQLVGVAPFFRSCVRVKGPRVANRLQLVGSGQGGSLLELPQILTAPGHERAVLRAVVEKASGGKPMSDPKSWVEVSIGRDQGWFEPQWINDSGQPAAFFRHQLVRACVVFPLGESWAQTRSGLKRNVKESLRRSRNRLVKDGRPYSIRHLTSDLDESAVNRFFDLHRQRAGQEDREAHGDAFAEGPRRDFLRDLLPALGDAGRARILELQLGDEVVAAQLILHGPGTSYVHSSGFLASVWNLGPVTFLQEDAFRHACESGERWVNMSPGPNLAKMRWSEQVAVYDDFAFGFGPRSLLWRYSLFAAGQAYTQVTHAAAMASRA